MRGAETPQPRVLGSADVEDALRLIRALRPEMLHQPGSYGDAALDIEEDVADLN